MLLDATKAFDRVDYCKLFRILIDKKLPTVCIRLLANMYTNHVTPWPGMAFRLVVFQLRME